MYKKKGSILEFLSFNNFFDKSIYCFKESERLFKAFLKKTIETNLINALEISLKYIVNKEQLYLHQYSTFFRYKNLNINSNDVFSKPLISILIVSYNSGEDLPKLFDSINKQTYKKIEVVLIENGKISSEGLLKTLNCPNKYIKSNNIGFAAANNLAFENSNGDYICLVNPDTILDKKTIFNLLDSLKSDNQGAISIPKIIFYEKFIDITISSKFKFDLDIIALNESLNYKKYFIRKGIKKSTKNQNNYIKSENNLIRLSLPVDNSKAEIKILKSIESQLFLYEINNTQKENNLFVEIKNLKNLIQLELHLDQQFIWWGRDIINNAGSDLRNREPYDRGFGDYDLGHFDKPEYTRALCGCVAMISPKVFLKRKIFIEEFFAYYEDSELSSWVINEKLKIRYTPSAIVRHKHSATTEEGSITWGTLVKRSKNIYDFLLKNKDSITKDSLRNNYPKIPESLASILKIYDKKIIDNNRVGLYKKKKPSAGIYNKFWNTMGGGERHALEVAKLFSETHEIYLISEYEFDENKIKKYFSINFKFKKIVTSHIDSKLTSYFDVFINSTYQSNLVSLCNNSFYLVSFPQKIVSNNFLKSYFFIHNSPYTQRWAIKYWGKHNNKILYPINHLKSFKKKISVNIHQLKNNNKNLISIGRFTDAGHSKRHDYILRSFKKVQTKIGKDFNLFLVGSLDFSNSEDLNYFQKLKKLGNKNIYFFPNLEYEKLLELLSISKIYIHAAGVDKDPIKSPEMLEHFGISVIEAMIYGLYPIVYSIGGPSESIKVLNAGETFNDFDSLVKILKRIIINFDLYNHSIKENFLDPFYENNNVTLDLIKKITLEN